MLIDSITNMFLRWWEIVVILAIITYTHWKLATIIGYLNIKINTLYELLYDEYWKNSLKETDDPFAIRQKFYSKIHRVQGNITSEELKYVERAYKHSPYERGSYDWQMFLSFDDWAKKCKEKALINPETRETLFGPSLLDPKEFEDKKDV